MELFWDRFLIAPHGEETRAHAATVRMQTCTHACSHGAYSRRSTGTGIQASRVPVHRLTLSIPIKLSIVV